LSERCPGGIFGLDHCVLNPATISNHDDKADNVLDNNICWQYKAVEPLKITCNKRGGQKGSRCALMFARCVNMKPSLFCQMQEFQFAQ
jgi:hypothetical protein